MRHLKVWRSNCCSHLRLSLVRSRLIRSAMFGATYTCWTTVMFGIRKDCSLQIHSETSNNCFSHRNVFQNGVNALLKICPENSSVLPLLMLTLKVWSLSIHSLKNVCITCWWNLNKIIWSKVQKVLSFVTKNRDFENRFW